MYVIIRVRRLNTREVILFSEESKKFIHISYLKPSFIRTFHPLFVAEINGKAVVILRARNLQEYWKLGPLLVLPEYQKQGIGTLLVSHAVKKYKNRHLYIGSSNPGVWRIVKKHGFTRKKYMHLPGTVKKYLIGDLFQRIGTGFFWYEFIKAIKRGRRDYRFFIKKA